ncbi:MAG: alpha amylase N-terminal ig-like domain-containing protein [Acidobacteriota bacterium]|nr:alpha amylase N-terminal ig-like domain-containing protein [Acidobacteriota bacterium]
MTDLPLWLQAVHHDGSPYYLTPLFPEVGEPVRVRLRTPVKAPVEEVFLRWTPDGEQTYEPMQAVEVSGPARYWEIILEGREPVLNYHFLLKSGDGVFWYTAAGPEAYQPTDVTDFRVLSNYRSPEWLTDAVFYQIFPDTFCNGDPQINPDRLPLRYPGYEPKIFPWGASVPETLPFQDGFFGGDLIGVSEKLEYLNELGVNAVYLNPVFQAPSNHRYDVVDYFKVDPRLGGDVALASLRQDMNVFGMRYLLDVVPNHCGAQHSWFRAAQEDPDADETDFFTFIDHPDEYHSWLHFPSLPKFSYRSEKLRRIMFTDENSIFRRWLKPPYDADGWRIDVANMLGRQGEVQMNAELSRLIRRVVKETRPDAYLLGEHFFDAGPQLQGDMWDGVMNYAGFYTPFMHWLAGFSQHTWHHGKITCSVPYPTHSLEATWRTRRAAIPWALARNQLNLLSSHDTDRLRTRIGGDESLHRLAAVVQFAFPGVPCIFYGDELGVENVPKYGSRACMPWEKAEEKQALFRFYSRLTQLRRELPALQEGGFQMLHTDRDSFAFQREHPEGRILAVANRGTQKLREIAVEHGGMPDGLRLREVFSGSEAVVQQGRLTVNTARGATLWVTC